MMRFFSDPTYLLGLGILFTVIGVFATGAGTIRSSRIQAKEQLELRKRADEQAESQILLREKSDEIAFLNRQIADSQRILTEKAEVQTAMQRELTEKSEENAFLYSQIANLQRDLREKTELQIESQELLREKIEGNVLLSSQIAIVQRDQNQTITEIKKDLFNITDYFKNKMVVGEKTTEENKQRNGVAQIQGIEGKAEVGKIKVYVSSDTINISNGEIKHIFNNDLSIQVNINSDDKIKSPVLNAMLLSPGKKIGKIVTKEINYTMKYEKYVIKVNSISSENANLTITMKDNL